MSPVVSALLGFVIALFQTRASLHLENLALRHQLAVYQQTVQGSVANFPWRSISGMICP